MLIQEKKFKEYLSQEYEPVDETVMPFLVDLRAIKAYADSKGVAIASLSEEEKRQFMIPNPNRRTSEHNAKHAWALLSEKEETRSVTIARSVSMALPLCFKGDREIRIEEYEKSA